MTPAPYATTGSAWRGRFKVARCDLEGKEREMTDMGKRKRSRTVTASKRMAGRSAASAIMHVGKIERAILLVRGERVILDADLAKLYGVATKALNQAVKRNLQRFPEDFMFQLTLAEARALRTQFVTSKE
jgi:hypothetical protein